MVRRSDGKNLRKGFGILPSAVL